MVIMTDGAVGSAEKADGMAVASVGTADFAASPSEAVASTAEAVSKVEAGSMGAVGSTVDAGKPELYALPDGWQGNLPAVLLLPSRFLKEN
jgi:hypothetical protein